MLTGQVPIHRGASHRSSFLVGLLAAAAVLSSAGAVHADDWPLFRHDSRNTGFSLDTLKPPFKLAWRIPTVITRGGGYDGAILASGNRVCVTSTLAWGNPAPSNRSQVQIISLSDKRLWTIRQAAAVYMSRKDLVLFRRVTNGISIECYDCQLQTLKWSSPILRSQESPVAAAVYDGNVYCDYWVGSHPEEYVPVVRVLRLRDGQLMSTNLAISAEAVDGTHIFWGAGHWLHVVNATTLKPEWGFYDGGEDPVIAGSIVIGHGWGNWATAIDIRSRTSLWRNSVWRDGIHPLLHTADGRTLILESTNVPVAATAFRVDTDRIAWRRAMFCFPYTAFAQAAGAGHYALVPGWHEHLPGQKKPRGGFYCLDADTGAQVWQYERPGIHGTGIIVSGGCLYGLDDNGYLYRFENRN